MKTQPARRILSVLAVSTFALVATSCGYDAAVEQARSATASTTPAPTRSTLKSTVPAPSASASETGAPQETEASNPVMELDPLFSDAEVASAAQAATAFADLYLDYSYLDRPGERAREAQARVARTHRVDLGKLNLTAQRAEDNARNQVETHADVTKVSLAGLYPDAVVLDLAVSETVSRAGGKSLTLEHTYTATMTPVDGEWRVQGLLLVDGDANGE